MATIKFEPSISSLKDSYGDWGVKFETKYSLEPSDPHSFYSVFWSKFRARIKIGKRDEFIRKMKQLIYPYIPVRSGYLMDTIMRTISYSAVIPVHNRVEIFINYSQPMEYRPIRFYGKVAHNYETGWGKNYQPITEEGRRAVKGKKIKVSPNRMWGKYLLVDSYAQKDYEKKILEVLANYFIYDVILKILDEMKLEVKIK